MQKRIIYISVLSALLTACGGGGSFDTPTSTPSDKKDNDGTAVIDPSLIKTGKEDKTGTESPSKDEKKKQGEVEKVKAEAEKAKAEAEKAKAEAEKAKAEAEKNKKDESNTQQPPATETPKVAFKVATQEQIDAHNKLGEDNSSKVEYGFSLATPITGYPLSNNEIYNEAAPIDESKAQKDYSEDSYDTLTFINNPSKVSKDNEPEKIEVDISKKTWEAKPGVENYGSAIVENLSKKLDKTIKNYFYIDKKEGLKLVEFNNTKIGALLKPSGADYYANLFYKGKNPSEAMPTSGTATYHGVWDVAQALTTDTGITIPSNELVNSYHQLSMAPLELTADFGQKTLKGKLEVNETSKKKFAYDVDATINENTFSGTAISTEGTNKATISDTAKVDGGFFGEQAAELAGKLIGKNAFGVFAAKQISKEDLVEGKEKPKTQYSQGKILTGNFSGEFDGNIGTTDGTKKLDNIDELNKITINGTEVDLLEVAKTENYPVSQGSIFANTDSLPLQFTRFGSVLASAYSSNTPNTFSYFYQGQLTQDMPETGTADYKGDWIGYGKTEKGAIYSVGKAYDAKINFTADFAGKTLNGQFKTPTGNEAMSLKGVTFDGNTFSGMADITSKGLTNDKDGNQERMKGTVKVSGAFFGPQANELGGEFHKEDNSFAGVFAGKQIQK